MTTIHWFRRDLRLGDNPALAAAVAGASSTGGEVVGLFVLDDALWRSAGARRRAYLRASLAALDEQTGGRLVVRRGDPAVVVPAVAREVAASAVHLTATFEPYGLRRDRRVAAALDASGIAAHATGSAYAVSPGRVRTGAGSGYRVYTPFRRAWAEHGWHAPAPRPDAVPWARVRSDGLPPAEDGEGLPAWVGAGEEAALARWRSMLERVGTYADERDRPDLDSTSRLSVSLKWGEIHPRTVLADLAGRTGRGAETFRSQIAWRDFHADVLFHTPAAAYESIRQVVAEDAWAAPDVAAERLAAWAAGRTGYPIVDAGMRQLLDEGWMHNRVRMIVASFLVKDLHVPWQRGAAHFMAHLLDGDIPQNQLNWQWVAGTGLDAAPFFRVFNPVTQGRRFDPDGEYVRRHVPELRDVPGADVHEPWTLLAAPPDYPLPIVDHAAERRVTLADHETFKERTGRD